MLSTPLSVLFTFVFSLLTFTGLLGNLLVMIAIAADSHMRSCVMNILLLNLAVADVSNVLVAITEWAPAVFNGRAPWALPPLVCPATRYVECVFLYASISTQLVVCMERYVATAHPMQARYLCTRRSALNAVLMVWTCCALFALPHAVFNRVNDNGACRNTVHPSEWWMRYKFLEFLLYFVFPCCCIFSVYSRVAMLLWAANPHLKNEGSRLQGESSARQLATRRSVVKMLVACAVVYFICYAPIQAVFISKVLFGVHVRLGNVQVLALHALAVTCSASNPLLYALFSLRFRKRLRALVVCPAVEGYSPVVSAVRPSFAPLSTQ